MPCPPHKYSLESPQEASQRAQQDHSDPSIRATCKTCGKRREYLTDKGLDEQYDIRAAHNGIYDRADWYGGVRPVGRDSGSWDFIDLNPLPSMPEWDDLGPVR